MSKVEPVVMNHSVDENTMRVREVKIEDLKLYENNAKIHTDSQIKAISNSVEQFGMNVPILVNSDYVVVAGHGRIEALRALGVESVPVLELPEMTPEQEKAFRIVDNSIGMSTGFDSKILQEEIGSLYEFDMTEFGFGFPALTAVDDEDAPPQRDVSSGSGNPRPPKGSLPKCKCPSCGHRFNKVVKTEDPKPQAQVEEVTDLDKALEEFLNS